MASRIKLLFIGSFMIINFGCTKEDFTWNLKKKPCVVTFDNSSLDHFTKIAIANMINETQGSGPINSYEDKPIILKKGNSYDLSVSFDLSWAIDFVATYAYFDWNGDGDFLDTNESILLSDDTTIKDVVKTIEVPADAVPGITYARFILQIDYYSTPANDPCLQYGDRGEVEDYPLIIE